jgi:diaminopimelate decarboxylase
MASYDPYYSDVVMLLRGNGANNSQSIIDEKGHSIDVYGNTCINTDTTKYGGGSIYFDGSGDYLVVPPTDFYIGAGQDFTIDGWIYPIGSSGTVNFRLASTLAY